MFRFQTCFATRADACSSRPLMESLEQRKLLSVSTSTDVSEPVLIDAGATRQMETLDRGVVALHQGNGNVYISWRMLGLDPDNIAFNLYRSTDGGATVRLNDQPLTQTTDFRDRGVDTSRTHSYFVRPLIDGSEGNASKAFVLAANTPARKYLSVLIQAPPGGVLNGIPYTYSANDTSAGDLDGDGDYELIVKWDPSNSGDNNAGFRSNVFIDAYTLEGQQLWRIDLGRNVRAGPHYTQFQVYDLDGDGRAEIAMRTAPGTIDGQGNYVLLPGDDPQADYRNSDGYILAGPEYLTVFDGLTGGELASVPFEPHRGHVSEWGDGYGNRVDRFTAGVAYLDGQRPSLIMGRGYYKPQTGYQARNEVAAYDYRDGQLSLRWIFKAASNGENPQYIGQGAHSITVGDVDGDGFDEVVYGAAVIDHDGTGLYSTTLGHGDALHMSDMNPDWPGLEIFQVHEDPAAHLGRGGTFRDAATGVVLSFVPGTGDVGRGVAFDIDPNYAGYEMWTSGDASIYNVSTGLPIYDRHNAFFNFGVWWDADPLRELLDGETISKWHYEWDIPGRRNYEMAWQQGAASNNGTKKTPALSGDILGDWREEVVWRNADSTELQVWTTMIPATTRMYTLMHDAQYRAAIAWQNSGYNQPPHPSFFVGHGMGEPPTPDIAYVGSGDASNKAPVVAVPASAPGRVTDSSVELSVLGDDDSGEKNLTYAWSATGPAPVEFSTNGSNAAKQTAATFSRAGTYRLTVTITDAAGLTALSSVDVTVDQVLTDIAVTPNVVTVDANGQQQFSASSVDQFGHAMSQPPVSNWSVTSGEGRINSQGLYSAPSLAGSAIVQLEAGGFAQTADVTISSANTVPNAPSNLTAEKFRGRQATLVWNDTADNENGFRVWASQDGMTWRLIATLSGSEGVGASLGYTTDKLAGGTWYFRVTAYNDNGESSDSGIAELFI